MSTSFSWLHLTDFHQGAPERYYFRPSVNKRFFKSLEKIYDRCGPWDLVLFTGDLTYQGSVKEFQDFDSFLEKLWEQFDKLRFSPKLLAVPGNHDLVWPKDYQSIEEDFCEEDLWKERPSYREVITEAFNNYVNWLERQPRKPDNLEYGILPGDFSFTLEKENIKLGIVGLNTAFLQLNGNDYKGKLILDARQFNKACGDDGPEWVEQHAAWLLMTHHPREWLTVESQRDHLNGEIVSHGNFAVHLCGHLHEADYKQTSEAGAKIQNIWLGRSLFGLEYVRGKEERSHGYTIGRIEFNDNKRTLVFWPRLETRFLYGGREIVPDYLSISLTDDQHTEPRGF